MNDFKKNLAETHVRLAEILQELERLHELDADKGEHCLKYLNQAIARWMPSFEYVQTRTRLKEVEASSGNHGKTCSAKLGEP